MIKIEDGDYCKGCKLVDMYNELEEKDSFLFDNNLKTIVNLSNKIKELRKEIKQYQKELEKADSITQSCIFNGKKYSEISYRKCLNIIKELKEENKQLKEKINKVLEYINDENDRLDLFYLDEERILEMLKGDSND